MLQTQQAQNINWILNALPDKAMPLLNEPLTEDINESDDDLDENDRTD